MKTSQTRILGRKILLSVMALKVVLALAALFVSTSLSKKLETTSNLALSYDSKVKPDDALLLLNQAEDDFQQSLIDLSRDKSTAYRTKLKLAFNKIDTLIRQNADTTQLSGEQRKNVKLWHEKKIQLSERLLVLKRGFDSLLYIHEKYHDQADQKAIPNLTARVNISQKTLKKTDTVKRVISPEKKGLFGRLKDAIANKPNSGTGVIEINHNVQTNVKDGVSQSIAANADKANRQRLQKLEQIQQRYGTLLDTQRKLILLNADISAELERILSELKEINYQMSTALKDMAFKNYQETTGLLNKLYVVAVIVVLLSALLLILFITKLANTEQLLRLENERAVNSARQKMDLLAHMSHEIRNPLTAIQGFLHVFSRANLSERQAEMLKSVTNSSDMLLRTLNDTLDAAKMESSRFTIEPVPFNPDFTIRQVIESMNYSADKKKLSLSYVFLGNEESVLVGDEFRLKQILVNLISNAIKYTEQGNINIRAELVHESTLQIDVIDTGKGIAAEQLPELFSKYYRTSSSKGQLGTGLGLYICKQLVEMQNGEISVKSEPSKGTTFSFFVPYRKPEASEFEKVIDPLSVLSGLNVLAVDDDEMNLMVLKLITAKWNVNFHQVTTAMDALRLLANTPVDVVFTDIQMPDISGYQLLKAIRRLPAPRNQVTVIAATGAGELQDNQQLIESGFSGYISKPFVEDELAEVIVRTLRKSSRNV